LQQAVDAHLLEHQAQQAAGSGLQVFMGRTGGQHYLGPAAFLKLMSVHDRHAQIQDSTMS
jgi:hypothetical protein